MNKNYLHTFNDLLKELEKRKKNPFPKRKSPKKDISKNTDKEKDDQDDKEDDDDDSIPSFLKQKAPGLNIDYGTAGSRITEKVTLSKLIKK